MPTMCFSCGWTADGANDDRDVVEFSVPGRAGTRSVCTECLDAASTAWVSKSLPQLNHAIHVA